MLQTKQDSEQARQTITELRKRMLKAILAPLILALLSEMTASSATNFIEIFKERFGIQLGPGTLYPVLYRLEKQREIKSLPNRRKKLYVLTNKGKEIIEDLQAEIENLQSMVCWLIAN